jgi:hypothetical protein
MTLSNFMLLIAICVGLLPVMLYMVSKVMSMAYFASKLDYHRKLMDEMIKPEEKKR